jgi:hypothetical protein
MTRAELACAILCTNILAEPRLSLGMKGGMIARAEKRFLSKQDPDNGGTHG